MPLILIPSCLQGPSAAALDDDGLPGLAPKCAVARSAKVGLEPEVALSAHVG
jgi:hypothetical protein